MGQNIKVLFVQPPNISYNNSNIALQEPLHYLILAASIQDICEVKILDLRIEKKYKKLLLHYRPKVLCISGWTFQVETVNYYFKLSKFFIPSVLTISGGFHATFDPDSFLKSKINIIVNGPGLPTFRHVIESIISNKDYRSISGISYYQRGRYIKTPDPQHSISLDEEPLPNRDLTKNYRSHYHAFGIGPISLLRTSDGCPNRCKFCYVWNFYKKKYRVRSIENIIMELKQIDDEIIHITDDNFLFDENRLLKLYYRIKEEKISKKYSVFGSAEFILSHPDILKKWAKIGLYSVLIGIESFDNKVLKTYNKTSSVEMNEKAIKILHSFNIKTELNFIIHPTFTKQEFKKLHRYIAKLDCKFKAFIGFSALTPLPGTQLWEETKNNLRTKKYKYFDFIFPVINSDLSIKRYFWELLKLYLLSNINIPFFDFKIFNKARRKNNSISSLLNIIYTLFEMMRIILKFLKRALFGHRFLK